MATRRICEYRGRSMDGEVLQVIEIYPVGVNKETVKRENTFSKKHSVLVGQGFKYTYRKRRV